VIPGVNLSVCRFLCLYAYVCLSAGLDKKLQADLAEIFREN